MSIAKDAGVAMTIVLRPELETRLKQEAQRRGVDVSEYASRLIDEALSSSPSLPRPDQATLDLFDQWDQEEATDDPAEIERRRRETQEFMVSLAQSRIEAEGPN